MRTPQGYRALNLATVLIKIISGIRYDYLVRIIRNLPDRGYARASSAIFATTIRCSV